MSMGTTSRVVLNDEMQKAKGECQSFRSQVKSLAQELDSIINTLLSTGFQGEAADGLKQFYDNNIAAFLADGGTFDQYLSMFDKDGDGLFDSIEKALTIGDGVDPALGDNNKNIGQSTSSGS